MRPEKAITGLSASPSQIKKKLKNLRPPGYNMDIDELLVLASQKIRPIIELLVESPKCQKHFIAINKCDDIEEIVHVITNVLKALEKIGFQIGVRDLEMSMGKYRKSANSQGNIYVDTTLLLQILELYNIIESLMDDLDAFYRSIGIHSFVQTESGLLSLSNKNSYDSNKMVFKLKTSPSNGISSFGFLQNDFLVMPTTSKQIIPVNESKSEIFGSDSGQNPTVRKSKSASSVENEQISGVTDIYGARKVLVKCIYDLQGVNDYLCIPRKDASTICSRAEVDSIAGSNESGKTTKKGLTISDRQNIHQNDSKQKCCCEECFAYSKGSGANLQECEDDQVIICIKGCNEDEGDVQIVIRQCPDCKKGEDSTADKSIFKPPPVSKESQSIPYPKSSQMRQPGPKTSSGASFRLPEVTEEKGYDDYSDENTKKTESIILHNKDSQGSIVCSDEEDEENDQKPFKLLPNVTQSQARTSCSRIKLFETTNLCLETETGQELVISLTVTPKDLTGGPKRLSITDIFSDNEYVRSLATDSSSRSKKQNASQTSGKSGSMKKPQSYFVADRYIPLGRTKICSSLDFDVTTADSKIREQGIKNKNNKIVVQLEDFGTDNLLRACRPAKCCRKAVLNEKMKKCLPYAPSLRSLPLDDDDLKVINQSLEMSLQKVKNSTNIKKDFYANQMLFMNPIHTIMYFFIEENSSKNNLNDICQRNLLTQKLNYYINLVNDIQYESYSKYAILYFGVESKLGNHQTNQFVKSEKNEANNKISNVEISNAISNPLEWMKQRYNKYQERPLLTSHQILLMKGSESYLMRNARKNLPIQASSKCTKKKSYVSRIPIYHGSKELYITPTKINIEQEAHNTSLVLMPQLHEITENVSLELSSEMSSSGKENPDDSTKHSKQNFNKLIKSKNSSMCSVTSTITKTKRKKKEFYQSRSRSDISLGKLKHVCKNKNSTHIPEAPLKTNVGTEFNFKEIGQDFFCPSNPVVSEQESCKLILNYFSKILYQMIKEQMSEGKQNKERGNNSKHQISISVGTKTASLQELYRKQPNTKKGLVRKTNNLDVVSSSHDLKAKQSQYCMVQSKNINNESICILNSLALQTSVILADNKNCQTSNTLLVHILNSNPLIPKNKFEKKRIFKKTFNCADRNGLSNSCDEIDNFIVTLRSDHSLNSNFSERYFTSSNSCSSRQWSENDQDDSLSQSLIKLKETLEKYENIKTEIAQGSLEEANINPIEYFVYQVCACNSKLNKKPSVMQRILSKTKGLFSSIDKDVCRKYKNQREFLSMSPKEREGLCHQCGCPLLNCGEKPSAKKVTPSPLLCKCPQEHKTKKQMFFNKFASASSLKSIKTCIKKSVSDICNRGKERGLKPCTCDKKETGKKRIDTLCVPQNMSIIRCEKKSISTGTTKESSTQKCECGKCANFADDGTCCCSHCLGCLDKSTCAKPDNNHVGIDADAKNLPTDIKNQKKSSVSSKNLNKSTDAKPDNNHVGIDTDVNNLPADTNNQKQSSVSSKSDKDFTETGDNESIRKFKNSYHSIKDDVFSKEADSQPTESAPNSNTDDNLTEVKKQKRTSILSNNADNQSARDSNTVDVFTKTDDHSIRSTQNSSNSIDVNNQSKSAQSSSSARNSNLIDINNHKRNGILTNTDDVSLKKPDSQSTKDVQVPSLKIDNTLAEVKNQDRYSLFSSSNLGYQTIASENKSSLAGNGDLVDIKIQKRISLPPIPDVVSLKTDTQSTKNVPRKSDDVASVKTDTQSTKSVPIRYDDLVSVKTDTQSTNSVLSKSDDVAFVKTHTQSTKMVSPKSDLVSVKPDTQETKKVQPRSFDVVSVKTDTRSTSVLRRSDDIASVKTNTQSTKIDLPRSDDVTSVKTDNQSIKSVPRSSADDASLKTNTQSTKSVSPRSDDVASAKTDNQSIKSVPRKSDDDASVKTDIQASKSVSRGSDDITSVKTNTQSTKIDSPRSDDVTSVKTDTHQSIKSVSPRSDEIQSTESVLRKSDDVVSLKTDTQSIKSVPRKDDDVASVKTDNQSIKSVPRSTADDASLKTNTQSTKCVLRKSDDVVSVKTDTQSTKSVSPRSDDVASVKTANQTIKSVTPRSGDVASVKTDNQSIKNVTSRSDDVASVKTDSQSTNNSILALLMPDDVASMKTDTESTKSGEKSSLPRSINSIDLRKQDRNSMMSDKADNQSDKQFNNSSLPAKSNSVDIGDQKRNSILPNRDDDAVSTKTDNQPRIRSIQNSSLPRSNNSVDLRNQEIDSVILNNADSQSIKSNQNSSRPKLSNEKNSLSGEIIMRPINNETASLRNVLAYDNQTESANVNNITLTADTESDNNVTPTSDNNQRQRENNRTNNLEDIETIQAKQFGRASTNPFEPEFEQYLLNVPQVNMFQVNNPDSAINE